MYLYDSAAGLRYMMFQLKLPALRFVIKNILITFSSFEVIS